MVRASATSPPGLPANRWLASPVHRLQYPAEPVRGPRHGPAQRQTGDDPGQDRGDPRSWPGSRSEEHTSELQSRFDLVCRLLPEKKKNGLKGRPDEERYEDQLAAETAHTLERL